jgi:hypothetical protein
MISRAAGDAAGAAPKRTSAILSDFANGLTAPRVSVGEIVEALGDRGLGVLIAIFALPAAVPVPTFPGFTAAFGLPIAVFAVQLMLRWHRLVLPGAIARRTIATPAFRAIALKVAHVLSRIEKLLRPRFAAVTGPLAERFLGALCACVALAVAVPLPFGHNVAAFGLALIGLGLIERDGVAILLGVVAAIAGVALLALVVFGITQGIGFLLHM